MESGACILLDTKWMYGNVWEIELEMKYVGLLYLGMIKKGSDHQNSVTT
jgi:hypothetical protein